MTISDKLASACAAISLVFALCSSGLTQCFFLVVAGVLGFWSIR